MTGGKEVLHPQRSASKNLCRAGAKTVFEGHGSLVLVPVGS